MPDPELPAPPPRRSGLNRRLGLPSAPPPPPGHARRALHACSRRP
ncbi:MAG: hypothetical protein ACK56F_33045 [bacterium]